MPLWKRICLMLRRKVALMMVIQGKKTMKKRKNHPLVKKFICVSCNFKTIREENLGAHINNVDTDEDYLFDDGNGNFWMTVIIE